MSNIELKGINEEKMNKLAISISDYNDRLKEALNCVNDVMNETNNFYKTQSANELRKKFSLFETNFKIMTENISSYSEDIISAKNKYKEGNLEVAQEIMKAASNITVDQNIIRR